MLKKVYGSAVFGVEAYTITVEVNVDNGIGYHLVGLPDNAIKERHFRRFDSQYHCIFLNQISIWA